MRLELKYRFSEIFEVFPEAARGESLPNPLTHGPKIEGDHLIWGLPTTLLTYGSIVYTNKYVHIMLCCVHMCLCTRVLCTQYVCVHMCTHVYRGQHWFGFDFSISTFFDFTIFLVSI